MKTRYKFNSESFNYKNAIKKERLNVSVNTHVKKRAN